MFKAFSQNKRRRRSAAFLLLYGVSNCFYLEKVKDKLQKIQKNFDV